MGAIIEVLRELGFEDREVKIYLLLLREGDLPALAISRKTGIDRTTIYDILERLILKGIVSVYSKNKFKQFHALQPGKLLLHFKEKYSSLEKILPELNKLPNQNQRKVSCELFQGKEGIKIVLGELISRGKDYKVIGIRKKYEEVLGFFNEQGVLKLNEFKAKEFAIIEKGTEFIKLKNGEYRYLDKNTLSQVTTLIYEDIVVFFIWAEPYYAVRIESNNLREAQENYFDLLWKLAKK
jgi:sugar-specific transcriptional regulator TrmB